MQKGNFPAHFCSRNQHFSIYAHTKIPLAHELVLINTRQSSCTYLHIIIHISRANDHNKFALLLVRYCVLQNHLKYEYKINIVLFTSNNSKTKRPKKHGLSHFSCT